MRKALLQCGWLVMFWFVQNAFAASLPNTITVADTRERTPLIRVENDAVKVDGHVDEVVWQQASRLGEFVVIEPDTGEPERFDTFMRAVYTDKGIYVSAVMEQPVDTLIKRLSGRDQRDNRDSFTVTLDTSGEGLYGFWFGVNLGDTLIDGSVRPEREFSRDWDGPWYGRSQTLENGWSVEIFVPWGVVAMPASGSERTIGIYASRKVAYLDERWAWPALPRTQPKFLSAVSLITVDDVQPRQQYNIYPFIASGYDFIDDEDNHRIGADVFWRPSSNFQINATINPDFGIVESDDVDINLTATETFFPEKRLFFQEEQTVFVTSPRAETRRPGVGRGGAPYTLVNTRRIGGRAPLPDLADDASISQRQRIQLTELTGAVKVTGQQGKLRYGMLSAFEEDVRFIVEDDTGSSLLRQAGNDYAVGRLLYEDSSSGYRAVGLLTTSVLNQDLGDAHTQGVDLHFLNSSGSVKIDAQLMSSDLDAVEDRGYGGFVDFEMTYAPGVRHRIGIEYIDENLDINDLGFLQRNDHYRLRSAFTLTRANLGWARENQLDVRGFAQKNISESLLNGGGVFIANRTDFLNLSRLVVRLNWFPGFYDDLNSFGNGTFRVEQQNEATLSWDTDSAKDFRFGFTVGYAEEDLGDATYEAGVRFEWQPTHQINVGFEVNYRDRSSWLLHQEDDLFATFDAKQWTPEISLNYFISARQQLRLGLQWIGIRAEENDFFTVPQSPGRLLPTNKPSGPDDPESFDFSLSQYALQLRYRWELAPLSDLFLVYTRQANVARELEGAGFGDIFDDAWEDPVADIFVMKFRYRFGS